MTDPYVACSFVTTLSATSKWARDIEVVGEGIGIDLAAPGAQCSSREIGNKGEDIAVRYLEREGMEILERNWRCLFGEVDIIALDGDTVVLVEVKTRVSRDDQDTLMPELAVGNRKRGKYQKLALIYLAKRPQYDSVRFDVAAVSLVDPNTAHIRYLTSAFEWDY